MQALNFVRLALLKNMSFVNVCKCASNYLSEISVTALRGAVHTQTGEPGLLYMLL